MSFPIWQRDLFRLGPAHFRGWVAARVGTAVALPLVAGIMAGQTALGVIASFCAMLTTFCDTGGTHRQRLVTMTCGTLAIVCGGVLGAELGGSPQANEILVVLAAFAVGLLAGTRPSLAVVARFGAIGIMAGAGVRWPSGDFAAAAAGGGATALAVIATIWKLWPREEDEALQDWRTTIARTFEFERPDLRFAIAIALAAAIALFAADVLQLRRPYWATITLLMVMRREGTESLRLTLHYVTGTLAGLFIAAVVTHFVHALPWLVAIAVAVAAVTRIALAINPALGFASFTVFLLLLVDAGQPSQAAIAALWWTRMYDVGVGCALSLLGTLLATWRPLARIA